MPPLLPIQAGYAKDNAKVTGSIAVNGDVCNADMMRKISGFVHQEDVILDTMTVREALLFAAYLKLPQIMTPAQKVSSPFIFLLQLVLLSARLAGAKGDGYRRASQPGEEPG